MREHLSKVGEELGEALIDVHRSPLIELDVLDDSVVDQALRHVFKGSDSGPVAGFTASI
ncbi:hypothetical protein GCM10009677_17530 [Sphaerisporangium rubeum]